MDCATSRWQQCPAFLDDGPSCHHTCGGYFPVVLFKEYLVSQFDLPFDEGHLCQVQVIVGKQVFPFDQQLPGLVLFLLWPLLQTLEVQLLKDSVFQGPWLGSPEATIGRTTGGTWLAGVTLPMTILAGITMGCALRFLKQIGTQEESGCNSPYVAVSTMEPGSCRPHADSASTWTHMQNPQTSMLPCVLTVENGGMVTLCVVWTCPWTPSRENSLGAVGSVAAEGVTPFTASPSPLNLCGAAEATQT